MTKKCLIFNNYRLSTRDGGPSGFLAQNIKGNQNELYHLGGIHPFHPTRGILGRIRNRLRGDNLKTGSIQSLPDGSAFIDWLRQARLNFLGENTSAFSVVWFHDVLNLYACSDLIGEHQTVILQPHTPQLASEEEAANGRSIDEVRWVQDAERASFNRADYVVLPNAGAKSIYTSLFREDQKFKYIASGCQKPPFRFQIPLDSNLIFYLFIGRRNLIKGFDIVLEAFKEVYESDKNVRLILVGEGEVIEHAGIIDIGFSSEPGSWLRSCDYMINANRQSYFDLSFMEAVSLGTPILYSQTGGHSFLGFENPSGLVPWGQPSVANLVKALNKNKVKRINNIEACLRSEEIFQRTLSSCMYRTRVDEFLKELLGDVVAGCEFTNVERS